MASRSNMSSAKGVVDTGKPEGGPVHIKANARPHTVGKKGFAGGDDGLRRRIAELEAALSILRVIAGVVARNDDIPRQVRRPLLKACSLAAQVLGIRPVQAPRRGHPLYDAPRSENELPRWTAVVWYRSDAGCIPVKHMFEEMDMLHDLIENGGPDFLAIDRIEVRLSNSWTRTHTIEQHAKQPDPKEVLQALEIINKKREAKAQGDGARSSRR